MIPTSSSQVASLLQVYTSMFNTVKHAATSLWNSICRVLSSPAIIKSNSCPKQYHSYRDDFNKRQSDVIKEFKANLLSGKPMLKNNRGHGGAFFTETDNRKGGLAARVALRESLGIWRPYTGGMMNVCDDDNTGIRYNSGLVHQERYVPPMHEYLQPVLRDMIESVNVVQRVWPGILQGSPYKPSVNGNADLGVTGPKVVGVQLKPGEIEKIGVYYRDANNRSYSDW
ncbi:hypothetical protein [Rouxiella silvae]|uniref:hypothetical protein n=1 Tax=Rouxiella silvae TaxID=1646373 RepID=UPI00111C5693|nr:hypothetical protein [Rouxiella silvae]